MKNKQRVINLYDNWYRNNRENIINKNWNLIDESTLYNPEGDKLRGLNIIVYLPISLSEEIDKKIFTHCPYGWRENIKWNFKYESANIIVYYNE